MDASITDNYDERLIQTGNRFAQPIMLDVPLKISMNKYLNTYNRI
jgi:hypothetical protein